ncbi:hypothetical protein AB0G04_10230 [Actinoplanes sp. NPDC023801]|uniref:hypothetical protein n=1 Tax=Actinoplanes sp. NPDC023801 TaxID=3154595 RepID=UPI0033D068AF
MAACGGEKDDDGHGGVMLPGPSRESRSGRTTALAAVVLLGLAALALLAVLLVVSPAAFVSLLPGWFSGDGSAQAAAWLVAGLSAALAAIVGARREVAGPLRGAVIALLITVAGVGAVYAFSTELERRNPVPENTCVAYSGGRHTCPGG